MEEEIKPLTVSPINPNMVIHVDEDTGEETTFKQMEQAIDDASVVTDELKGSSVGLTATRSIISQIVSDEVQLNKKYGLNVSDMCGKGHEKVNGKCPKCGRPPKTMEELEKEWNQKLKMMIDNEYLIDVNQKDWISVVLMEYADGASDIEIRVMLGISNDLWGRLMKEEKLFSETIEAGRARAEAWWVRTGRTNLTNKDFSYQGFRINMANRFDWREKSDTDVTSKGEQVNGLAVTFVKPKE